MVKSTENLDFKIHTRFFGVGDPLTMTTVATHPSFIDMHLFITNNVIIDKVIALLGCFSTAKGDLSSTLKYKENKRLSKLL